MRLLLERFKEIPQIENIRMKRELTKSDTVGPEKAGPFHPPPPPKAKEENAPEPPTPPSQTDEKTDIEIEIMVDLYLSKTMDQERKE